MTSTADNSWAKEYEAPDGCCYVCLACGKKAKNRATGGFSPGWDESCFLNSAGPFKLNKLVHDIMGRVIEVLK